MNYAGWIKYDLSNGKGIGSTLFFSGCNFHCKGCFNSEAQDFNYGYKYDETIEDKYINHLKDKNVDHCSLLGGEVFQQDLDIILNLVKRIKSETGKLIYMWSGYLWEDLIKDSKKLEILQYIDILVDGQFEENKKDLRLKHKGSTNQREILVQESLKQKEVIVIN